MAEMVVLVHGLLRSPRSFAWLARELERKGYATRRFGYPSARGTIAGHAEALAGELAELAADPACPRVHVVGHSLGNLVARGALDRFRDKKKVGRVVMLVPPNHGSPVARWLAPLFGPWVPMLRELTDAEGSAARRLPLLPGVAVGVIAARFDHVVPEKSTHLAEEKGHVRLVTTHSTVLWNRRMRDHVVDFLRDGRFRGGR